MGPTWGQQDPGGTQVGNMKIVIWDAFMALAYYGEFENFPSKIGHIVLAQMC